jgi:superfamily II DNA or RNA helicase
MKDHSQLSIDFSNIIQFIPGCVENIKSMLPKLFSTQHEDVATAEKRFTEGKGFLFTNGTGTGKTFVGLGIAYRFHSNNKSDILIVVPTDKKCIDWIDEGKTLGLRISKLESTNDSGHGISVTTYANFYQNKSLKRRNFNLIIYDESHYLNHLQRKKKLETSIMFGMKMEN